MEIEGYKKYIKKYLSGLEVHDHSFFLQIQDELMKIDRNVLIEKSSSLLQELKYFGQIRKQYFYPLVKCILYGIIGNEVQIITMNSNALTKNKGILRNKPQYQQLKNHAEQLQMIQNRVHVPISYTSILPDYSKDYPIEEYDESWNMNIEYLEKVSGMKAVRLSHIATMDYQEVRSHLDRYVDIERLNQEIDYYQNNPFIVLEFAAKPDFQEEQIKNYLITGIMLEKIKPYAILLDVQKRNYPFEQKFYNYARKQKLPIILCGQKFS